MDIPLDTERKSRFRTPEYYWFNPETKELTGFSLVSGEYQAITT